MANLGQALITKNQTRNTSQGVFMAIPSPLRIGVLGAAAIVPGAVTGPAKSVPEVQVVTIAARNPDRARSMAHKLGIPKVHDTYDGLLADPEVDAVYNPLPNGLHAEWTIKALRAGKHVLCEKPFAANAAQAEQMAAAARETGLVVSEAFAYRYHPLAATMKSIIASGALGQVRHIKAQFCFLLPDPGNIRYRYDLAGGSAMDAGCYPVSLVRFLAGAEPEVVSARARTIRPQVDYAMRADLAFADGRTARVESALLSAMLFRSFVEVQGDTGVMQVTNPYHPHWFHRLTVKNAEGTRAEHVPAQNVYVYQLRAFAAAVRGEGVLTTSPDDAIGNMRVIDAMYDKAGLKRRGV
jgi:predicted dehydrogenase